jgi:hypothetical protein
MGGSRGGLLQDVYPPGRCGDLPPLFHRSGIKTVSLKVFPDLFFTLSWPNYATSRGGPLALQGGRFFRRSDEKTRGVNTQVATPPSSHKILNE